MDPPVFLGREGYLDTVIGVYVETSFFSAGVTDRGDPQSIVWCDASRRWWHAHRRRFNLCISEEVIAELSGPGFVHGAEALQMPRGLRVAELSPEVQGLASLLVGEKVMPGPSTAGDATHVADATIHAPDYLLGWNVKHLANLNKRAHLVKICLRLGPAPPQIVTPDLLWENADA